MASPAICTQLWYERAALRGVVSAPLVHTGRVRAKRIAAGRPLLAAGLAASLTDELRPGDLVVANELRVPAGVIGSPAG
ncbi:MAG: hypothetical protein J2P17_04370, partial [Mycobacterium sp.]|nr:hypothetical protein [Mycobacterium sp.]